LQYQPGQVCQEDQVHKIGEQILSTCLTFEVFKEFAKIFPKARLIKVFEEQ
jgi:hypothetical protein